jgi:hypothetical protein
MYLILQALFAKASCIRCQCSSRDSCCRYKRTEAKATICMCYILAPQKSNQTGLSTTAVTSAIHRIILIQPQPQPPKTTTRPNIYNSNPHPLPRHQRHFTYQPTIPLPIPIIILHHRRPQPTSFPPKAATSPNNCRLQHKTWPAGPVR